MGGSGKRILGRGQSTARVKALRQNQALSTGGIVGGLIFLIVIDVVEDQGPCHPSQHELWGGNFHRPWPAWSTGGELSAE